MAYLQETECCGIRELDEIQMDTAKGALLDAARDWFENEERDGAYIFFSTVQGNKQGYELEKLIKKHKLGTTLRTKPTVNPNTGNKITMWVWTVHKQNFEKVYRANKKQIEERPN